MRRGSNLLCTVITLIRLPTLHGGSRHFLAVMLHLVINLELKCKLRPTPDIGVQVYLASPELLHDLLRNVKAESNPFRISIFRAIKKSEKLEHFFLVFF